MIHVGVAPGGERDVVVAGEWKIVEPCVEVLVHGIGVALTRVDLPVERKLAPHMFHHLSCPSSSSRAGGSATCWLAAERSTSTGGGSEERKRG